MAFIETRKSANGKVTFRAQVRLKGYPIQSATFDRKTDAKSWAQQTESAMKEGRHFKTIESKRHTAAEMIDRYIQSVLPHKGSNKQVQEQQLNWWKQEIGSYLLADVSPALISEHRDKLRDGDTKHGVKVKTPATTNRYLAILSHCLTIAVNEWGWIEDSPMRKVRKLTEPRGRIRFLSDEERTSLLATCEASPNKLLYPIVVLALATGARQGEILTLKWDQVDLVRGKITLYDTKNKDIRVLPLAGHALKVIKDMNKVRHIHTDFLFPGKIKDQPIDIRAPWERALEVAEITDFRFHDLRHSAASYLAMNGATLTEIAEILGHKTLAMVKRYSHLTEQHTSKVVAKMNKQIFK